MKTGIKLLPLLLALLLLAGCGKNANPYADVPNPIATIALSDGTEMRAELFVADAPNTVANFVELANGGFYDGMRFSRIVPGVLIQSGDPKGDGTGNSGYAIRGEFAENGITNPVSHTRGTLSMSRQKSDMNSASSQFFILQGSYPEYDGQYAAFGRITDEASLAVLDSIASTPVDGSYCPVGAIVTIQSIRVETYGYSYEADKTEISDEK